MSFFGNPPFDKEPHQIIRSADWNDIGNKLDELDAAKVNRAGDMMTGPLTIDGNVGIGTTSPGEMLEVNGRIKSGALTIGTWPSGGGYVFFGTNAIDQAQPGNYALLQDSSGSDAGRTYLNSPIDIRFRISNSDRMVLVNNGNVGIGTSSPQDKLDINGALRFNGDADRRIYGASRVDHNTVVLDGHWNELEVKGRVLDWTGSNLHIGYDNDHADHYIEIGRKVGFIRLLSGGGTGETMRITDGKVGIGTSSPDAKLHVAGNLRLNIGEGLEFLGDNDYFGTYHDARIFRMIDGNGTDGTVDGGIAIEGYTPSDDKRKPIMAIKGNGRVGIGTPNPAAALHVDGDVQVGDNSTERQLTVYGPHAWADEGGALVIRHPGQTVNLRLDENQVECTSTLYLNHYSKARVNVGSTDGEGMRIYGNLHVYGNISASGDIGCHITDRFINQSGDTLEQGDVVILGGRSAKVFYGVGDNIPVPEADLTTEVYDHRVCGIVSEILVEEEPELPQGEKAAQAKGKTRSRAKAPRVHEDGVKRLQVFSAKELVKLDTRQVGQGQVGKMVTVGCFAHCKVDADIAPIEVGDLLTTSPTRGHAQKVLESEKAIGAIIGKALGSLETGKGRIPVLVMLQ